MNKNDIRVTYAVDAQTVRSIERLADEWGVSKSEAMRRAIQIARERVDAEFARMSPLDILEHCIAHPTRKPKDAAAWQREARSIRKTWDDR